MKTRLLVSLFTLSMVACATPNIAGKWGSECLAQPQADGSTNYYNLAFNITDKRWDVDYVVYGDDKCTTKLVTAHIAGPYTLERPSQKVEGAYEGRFDYDVKTLTPHVDALAGALQQMGCGTGTWKVGEAQDVYEKGCAGFGQYPKAQCSGEYDLVKIDGDKLQFGKRPADNNMCTEAKRPTELNPAALTRK